MQRLDQSGVDDVREHVAGEQRRHPFIELWGIRHAAAKHYHFRVDDVDHTGECAGELVAVALEGLLRGWGIGSGQLRSAQAKAGAGCPAGSGHKGLDAVIQPAIAATYVAIIRSAPGQRIVSPFAGDAVRPADQATVDDQATADAGTQNDPEHTARAATGAVAGLGKGEAVGVVRQPHRARKELLQICLQILADQADRVGILDPSMVGRACSRDADADAAILTKLALGDFD